MGTKAEEKNGLVCAVSQSEKTGKWGGEINLFKDGHYHRRVYTYEGPGFETEEEALQKVELFLAEMIAWDLEQERQGRSLSN